MRGYGWRVALPLFVALLLLLVWQSSGIRHSERATSRDAAPESPRAMEQTVEPPGVQMSRDAFVIQTRDLADGQPVAGVRVRVAGPSPAEAVSDERGLVTLTTTDISSVTVADPWNVAPLAINESLESGVLWVHGWIRVDGVVRARGDAASFTPAEAGLYVLVDGKHAPATLPTTSKLQRLVDAGGRPGRPSESGTFEALSPRVHGLTFAASLRGWKAARYTVDVRRNPDRDHAELWLERAVRVRGVIRSSEGLPIRNLPVSALSLVTIAPEDASPDQMRLVKPEGGASFGLDHASGKARAKFGTVATTDDEGRFELPLPVTGDVVVVAFPFGHRPIYRELGVPGSEDCEVEIVAERVHQPAFVRLVADGKPFEGGDLLVTDLSLMDGDAQPGVSVKVSADSRVPTEWLIPGRRFYFHIAGFSGHLVWDARETLDVARDLRSVSDLPAR